MFYTKRVNKQHVFASWLWFRFLAASAAAAGASLQGLHEVRRQEPVQKGLGEDEAPGALGLSFPRLSRAGNNFFGRADLDGLGPRDETSAEEVVGSCISVFVCLDHVQEYTVQKKEVRQTVNATEEIGVYHSLGKIIVEEGGHEGPLGVQNLQASLYYTKRLVSGRSAFQCCFCAVEFGN